MTAIAVAHSDHAPKASGPYSQAMVVGNLVYTAGQIPLDPASTEVVTGSIKQQTTRVLANLRAVLRAAGSDLDRVVKTTVFLVDLGDYDGLNEAYAQAFGDHKPARSTVVVAGLARGVRVEIEAVAVT